MKGPFLATSVFVLAASVATPALADDADDPVTGYTPPHVVDYTGGRIPPYAHLEQRTNTRLIESGLAVGGSIYALSVLYALTTCGAQMECRSGSQWLYIPVLGPFMTAVQAPTSGGAALSVFDGALQAFGAGLAVAGVLMPRSVVVWQDPKAAVRVAPVAAPGGAALSVTLTTL